MLGLMVISGLLFAGCIAAAGYWMWLIKGLNARRYRAFLRLLPVLDERIKTVRQLAALVAKQIKSEKALCGKIISLCDKASQETVRVPKRLILEVRLSKLIIQLVKAVQHYSSLRSNPKIMEAEITLAETEERIASDMLLFNTLTERYNREVQITTMRPFAAFLKLRRQREYYVVRED